MNNYKYDLKEFVDNLILQRPITSDGYYINFDNLSINEKKFLLGYFVRQDDLLCLWEKGDMDDISNVLKNFFQKPNQDTKEFLVEELTSQCLKYYRRQIIDYIKERCFELENRLRDQSGYRTVRYEDNGEIRRIYT